MSRLVGLLVSFLIGVLFSELFLVTDWRERIRAIAPRGAGAPRDSVLPQPPNGPPSPVARNASPGSSPAWRDLAAGRARKAQDTFLEVLVFDAGNEEAMRGLVAARRRLAGDDTALLRRAAERYRTAAARGTDTGEHYSPRSMRLLAEASVIAADQITAETKSAARSSGPDAPPGSGTPPASSRVEAPRRSSTDTRRTARTATRERPVREERRQAQPVTPPPVTTAPPATPPPEPSLDETEPFSIVSVGPVRRQTLASEIVGHLTLAGYAARMSQLNGGYLITLGPYRRSAVRVITQLIGSRFGAIPVAVRTVP